jgi:hypothetical protein
MVSEDHCSPRTDVLAEEMLQDARMAAMRKLQCSVVRSGQSPVWAVTNTSNNETLQRAAVNLAR